MKSAEKMINSFRKQELASLRGSGSAEEFDNLCYCLTEMVELLDGLESKKEKKAKKEEKRSQDENEGLNMRQAAMEGLPKKETST
jgi:hypothetical protein